MKKILAIALALMLAIPALAFADGNDACRSSCRARRS